jgi:glutamine amidotransferase
MAPAPCILSGAYGNRAALRRMLLLSGAEQVEEGERKIGQSSHVILCGVGAFDAGVAALQQTGTGQILAGLLQEGNIPVLGICLGMQMLGQGSEEGSQAGLGWMPARCRHLGGMGVGVVPHVGWETLNILKPDPLLAGLDEGARFYFSHSYGMDEVPPEYLLATPARGPSFAAVVRKGNAWGVQFHPEKSLRHGIKILSNFLNFCP